MNHRLDSIQSDGQVAFQEQISCMRAENVNTHNSAIAGIIDDFDKTLYVSVGNSFAVVCQSEFSCFKIVPFEGGLLFG